MELTFSSENFLSLCNKVTSLDKDLLFVVNTYGYPPMWARPNTFETLVHIILEQQVSLASALAALNKLKEKIQTITPGNLLLLDDEEMKSCYFSRQKTSYVRYLAKAILNNQVNLGAMENLCNDEVRSILSEVKGVGNWTTDIYLVFVLHRTDIFPIGDLAAVKSLRKLKNLSKELHRDQLLQVTGQWSPYRTIGTMILWHYYLSLRSKNKKQGT